MAAPAALPPVRRMTGRGRQPLHVERVGELELELMALTAERTVVAVEVRALSSRIQLAITADRPDLALHVAGRLDALADSLDRRGAA